MPQHFRNFLPPSENNLTLHFDRLFSQKSEYTT